MNIWQKANSGRNIQSGGVHWCSALTSESYGGKPFGSTTRHHGRPRRSLLSCLSRSWGIQHEECLVSWGRKHNPHHRQGLISKSEAMEG
ncbi:hypothetical protein L226DRAFT_262693 [Lentinus tigrinus ALCF2SS1-7]|uniref:uncharacterized protein n=1 Tax=Lentinus tigrinus ALCF2SS1-7 TaxID=1328758 RepID=UPI001166045A|nr:hypothetical protein L226DRAFT_262693 [Lentinus tigrinus ALCF2SS1-7]